MSKCRKNRAINFQTSKWNNYEVKIKMNGKKLYRSKFVKYFGVLIDSHLNFSFHINSNRLSRAIGMLAKIRHYVTKDTLHSFYVLYYIFFNTYIWMSNKHFNRMVILQNRAIKVTNFASFRKTASPL